MLPNIDPTTSAGMTGAATTPAKRQETDQLVQEANRALQNLQVQPSQERPQNDGDQKSASVTEVTRDAKAAENVQQAPRTERSGTTRIYERGGQKDKAEINFQLTREERDVFLNAMSGLEDPSEMTEEEQNTLQKVSERIDKLIEDAAAKSTERGERLEKAVKEWYSRLSNGKHKAPADLIRLIQQAAMGVADLSKVE